MGVGGQFCSRKEKQISGIRGLVLRRPIWGASGTSVGEEDSGKSAADRTPSSALSSGCKNASTAIDDPLPKLFPKMQRVADITDASFNNSLVSTNSPNKHTKFFFTL